MINYGAINPLSYYMQDTQGLAQAQDAMNQVPALKAMYANAPNVIAQQNLAANLLNQTNQDKLNVLPQMLQATLTGQNLQNQGTAISNQYIAPSDIARINLMTQQGSFYPMMAQANLLGAEGRYGYSQNMPLNSILNFVKTPAGQAELNNNPQLLQALNQGVAMAAQRGGFYGNSPMNGMQSMLPSVGMSQQPIQTSATTGNQIGTPPQSNSLPIGSSAQMGFPQSPMIGNAQPTMGLQQPFGLTPQDIANAQQASSAELQRSTSDETTRAQALNAQEVYQTAQAVNIQPLQYYSGVEGQAQLVKDKAAVVAGQPATPQLTAYNNFKQFEVPAMSDMLRQALHTSVMPGYVATMIKPMTDPTNSIWDNPQMVASRWSMFQNWIKDYATQRTAAVNKGIPSNIGGQYSNPMEGSTQTSGNSASNVSIPNSFSNPTQFQQWYRGLTPSQKIAYKQSLGDK